MDRHGRLASALRRRPHASIAMAFLLYTVTLLTTTAGPQGASLDLAALLIAALACGALVGRERWPVLALVVSTAAAEAYLFHYSAHRGEMVLAAPLIALYTVAEGASRRRALLVGGAVVAVLGAAHIVVKPTSWIGADNVALAALGGLAVAAGDASRSRRAYLAEAQARAAQAEADREIEAARRVTEERLRIARDLHDVLGHQLALIHVQSGVAAHALGEDHPRARDALDHVRTASRTALSELSETVGLLRQAGDPADPPPPAAGLSGLAELLAASRAAGLEVSVNVTGDARGVPAAVDLTAYRLLQESLTNARKHAGPVAVRVTVTYGRDELAIVVDNSAGAAPAAAAAGGTRHGLVGMRERVAALGGTLRAGRRPDGGYRVHATLPLGVGEPA